MRFSIILTLTTAALPALALPLALSHIGTSLHLTKRSTEPVKAVELVERSVSGEIWKRDEPIIDSILW
ncbi:hypothetical protein BJ508DRAFT_416467 [Ascobolus immersus RN42]|uniref:Uncharacterized protein n=1 Tax=Ascobolus immersus RN42 TaxID=1160509 RepID=A0A3N4HXK6_ASCIM|nr:hypothetical protein BJ508DRAFT_416467 [Ascobolus immersus RN42]